MWICTQKYFTSEPDTSNSHPTVARWMDGVGWMHVSSSNSQTLPGRHPSSSVSGRQGLSPHGNIDSPNPEMNAIVCCIFGAFRIFGKDLINNSNITVECEPTKRSNCPTDSCSVPHSSAAWSIVYYAARPESAFCQNGLRWRDNRIGGRNGQKQRVDLTIDDDAPTAKQNQNGFTWAISRRFRSICAKLFFDWIFKQL